MDLTNVEIIHGLTKVIFTSDPKGQLPSYVPVNRPYTIYDSWVSSEDTVGTLKRVSIRDRDNDEWDFYPEDYPDVTFEIREPTEQEKQAQEELTRDINKIQEQLNELSKKAKLQGLEFSPVLLTEQHELDEWHSSHC